MIDAEQLAEKVREFFGEESFVHYESKMIKISNVLDELDAPSSRRAAPLDPVQKARMQQKARALKRKRREAAKKAKKSTIGRLERKVATGSTPPTAALRKMGVKKSRFPGEIKAPPGEAVGGSSRAAKKRREKARNVTRSLSRDDAEKEVKGTKMANMDFDREVVSGTVKLSPKKWHDLLKEAATGDKGAAEQIVAAFAPAIRDKGVKDVEDFQRFLLTPYSGRGFFTKKRLNPRGGVFDWFMDGGKSSSSPGLQQRAAEYIKSVGGDIDARKLHDLKAALRYILRRIQFALRKYRHVLTGIPKEGLTTQKDDEESGREKTVRKRQKSVPEKRQKLRKKASARFKEAFDDLAEKGKFTARSDFLNKAYELIGREMIFKGEGDDREVDFGNLDPETGETREAGLAAGRVVAKLSKDPQWAESAKRWRGKKNVQTLATQGMKAAIKGLARWFKDNVSDEELSDYWDVVKKTSTPTDKPTSPEGEARSVVGLEKRAKKVKKSRRGRRKSKSSALDRLFTKNESVEHYSGDINGITMKYVVSDIYGINPGLITEEMTGNLFLSLLIDMFGEK